MKERKIMTSNEGPDKNVIILQPPMCFTCDNARTFVQAFDQALTEVENKATEVSQETSDSIQVCILNKVRDKELGMLNVTICRSY